MGYISAQTLQEAYGDIQMPAPQATFSGINSLEKSQACGPDTNGYAMAKATGLEALSINNATSAGAVGQYFDAPQSLSLSGVSFYAWKADATAGITMNVLVEIFAAAPDSTPTGLALASTMAAVDTVFGAGTLDALRKHAMFTTPVTVSSAYVVVISNATATPLSMVFNSWTAADGGQEWLSSVQIGANWLRSYGVNVGGSVFDADCLFEPHVSYDLEASYLIDDPCFATSLTLNYTNTSSPIINNRMYNVAAYVTTPELSYTWNYGDASPTENLEDASHTYASASGYTVTLTDTVFGWTTNCSTDSMVILGVAPVAAYSSVETGLSSTFTNTSTSGGTATYIWDFGDGNTSTLMNPTHVYTTGGTYTVCLTVTTACGSNTVCNPVLVTCPAPTPGYSFVDMSPVINFTNTSTAGGTATYLWDFGDGNTSTLLDPMHTYATDGNYTVCLTVTDACGSDSTCQFVDVSSCVNPIASFTTAGTEPTFDFTNTSTTTGSTVTYAWDFGDGNTASTMDASNTYTSNATYIVTLTVTDSCGTNIFTSTVDVLTIGVDELSLANVSIYPNPSNGIFSIEASAEMEKAYITDLAGKLIYSGNLSGNEAIINTGDIANGTYILSIRFADGMSQMVRLKVVR